MHRINQLLYKLDKNWNSSRLKLSTYNQSYKTQKCNFSEKKANQFARNKWIFFAIHSNIDSMLIYMKLVTHLTER